MTYDMTYSGPEVVLPIGKYGTVRVCFTDGGHAHVGSNTGNRHDGDVVTPNGEHWCLSVHVYKHLDWSEDDAYDSYRHKGSSRATYGRELPRTWRVNIINAIHAAVKAWVEEHPDVLDVAARNKFQHDLDRVDGEIADKQEQLDALKRDRALIMDHILALPELS